ncbi:MAG TPA: F0F1 ATP synthase subunit delta [Gammaproteobacteria bacterium]|nr:F0F1 ATP synthase subunit delta [Gammaproteobacteria bacterium]
MAEKMTVARPYAKAVFECATESQKMPEWTQALGVLSAVAKNNQVNVLLREDAISKQDMIELCLTVCDSSLGEPLHNFIALLVQRERLTILPEIELLYKKMQLDSENRIEVQFEAPVSLDKNQEEAYQKILEKYFARKVTMTYAINTSLLGGFLAKAGNFVIDGSIRGSLTNLKLAMGD